MSRKLGITLLKSVLLNTTRGKCKLLRQCDSSATFVCSRPSRVRQGARGLHRTSCLAATEDVKAPNFPDSISSGDVKFVKKEGDEVKMDEVVMEIETDKTAIPVMSPGNGKLVKFYVKEGEAVKSQQVLFQVDVTSTTASAAPAAPASAPPSPPPAAPAKPAAAAPTAAPAAPAAAVTVKVSGAAPAAESLEKRRLRRQGGRTGTQKELATRLPLEPCCAPHSSTSLQIDCSGKAAEMSLETSTTSEASTLTTCNSRLRRFAFTLKKILYSHESDPPPPPPPSNPPADQPEKTPRRIPRPPSPEYPKHVPETPVDPNLPPPVEPFPLPIDLPPIFPKFPFFKNS